MISCQSLSSHESADATLYCAGFTSGEASQLVSAAEAHGIAATLRTVTYERWGLTVTYAIIVEYDRGVYNIIESDVRSEHVGDES